MTSEQKTFLILDGNALLHRAWHAIPPLTTRDGRVVNAAYGFTNVIEKMLAAYKPDFMAVAWDLPGATFRHEAYAPYKAQREKKADELYEQIPIIQEILAAYGIPSLSAPGYEADDVIGTIATENVKRLDVQTIIVTGDRDTLQLINDRTKVLFFVKGLSEVRLFDVAAVQEKYGLAPQQLVDVKALMGDSSDNLPGVAGIGEKGATELVKTYGNVEGILRAFKQKELPEKFAKKFVGQEKVAREMRTLGEIVCTVPLPELSYDACALHEPDTARLRALFTDLEFTTLLKKYGGVGDTKGSARKRGKRQENTSQDTTVRVMTPGGIMGEHVGVYFQTKQPDIFGATFATIAFFDGKRVWIAEHPDADVLREAVAVLRECRTITIHGAKAFLHACADMGSDSAEALQAKTLIDSEVIAYMLNAGARDFPLPAVVQDILGIHVQEDAGGIVELLPRLGEALLERLVRDEMDALYRDIEMPLISVLFAMEREGIAVDTHKLAELSQAFGTRLEEITKHIYALAGKEFNINSPSQLATILFEHLALPSKGIKKTKSGFSTAAPELEKLWEEHEIIPLVNEYRELAKLKSTYADALPVLVAPDGRIHSSFSQTIAATGRLSSSRPNLQNIPIRTDLGREIRNAFIAKPHHVLLSADYSQIELRLAAELARDASLRQAFLDGADIHRRTAAEVWGISEDDVTKDQRAAAKAINFSILYGVGPRALARSTGMKFEEAKDFIARYFAVHPGIYAYIEGMKVQAREKGYVQTLFGRRRYLPDIHSGVPQLVSAAERMAMNMPIQGTQADLIKKAMVTLHAWLVTDHVRARLVLQVHDEVVLEVHEDDVAQVAEGVALRMREVATFSVPLVVDVAHATRWGEIA